MAHAQQTVTVPREIDEVFEFLADGMNDPGWRPDVTQVSLASAKSDGVGTVWAQTMRGPGRRNIQGDYRITLYSAPTRLDFEVIAGPARPTGSFTLTEVNSSTTEVTFTLQLTPTGLMRLMAPIINRQVLAEANAIRNLPHAMSTWKSESGSR